ncbi:MAG: phosphatidate cytidylyltransferase [Rickettsiales bacterium]|nr:phosphatidate cytidylyltransferase [Rickettsiales bacterium]
MVGKINLKNNNLIMRSISAILLIPLVIYIILDGSIIFYASIGLIAVLMATEWRRIIRNLKQKFRWTVFALIYITLFVVSLVWIRYQEMGKSLLLWLIVTTWMADTGAFIFGKIIGGAKLVPKISPKKTWAGLIGAIMFAGVSGLIFSKSLNMFDTYKFIWFTIVLGILAQLGDLSVSWVKRKADIKNSGEIIPGHGGILDRVDSLTMCSVILAVFLIFFRHCL